MPHHRCSRSSVVAMKEDRTVLGALVWGVVGAIVAALLFFAHQLLFHDQADEVDNHGSYEVQN